LNIFEEPKIDCHAHVLDPARYPYGKDVHYKPAGQEIGPAVQLTEVMKTFGVKHLLLVQPNSGYGSDNSCMLDAIRSHEDLFKGVAIADLDANLDTLQKLKNQGIVGIAVNATFHGTEYYQQSTGLIEKLAELDMFLQVQVENDQLLTFMPWIESIPVRVLIDHCGRPSAKAGPDQPGFKALLKLAETERVHVKLSGYDKFAQAPYPFDDAWPYVRDLVRAFTVHRCMWASDWPYLRARTRQDYGPLVRLAEILFPDPDDRQILFWETPNRLFGFAD
jgi:predicted TIM-barrel fold metal-dependent hydrolase